MQENEVNSRVQNEINHWRKLGSKAESIWGWNTSIGQIRAKRRVDFFIEKGGINQSKHILEIGCGTGIFTQKIYQQTNAKIIAIDISEELLSIAKLKVTNVEFKIGNAMQLSFLNNSFDCIYGSSVMHHLDLIPAIHEMMRVLKPGGKILFTEPNMINPHIFLQKNIPYLKKLSGDTPDETAFVRWNLKSQLANAGFRNIQITPFDFIYPFLPRILVTAVSKLGLIVEKIPFIREVAGSLKIYAEK